MKKTCLVGAILCFTPGTLAILFHFFPPYIPLWQIPGYYFIITFVNCYVNFWIITCKFLSKSGKTLARNFKV
jgi:ABC-type transport system involved in multi-copper enzyme maturation permease subunit